MLQAEVAGAVMEEERSHVPSFNVSAVYWDVMVKYEHAGRLHSFATSGTDDQPPESVSNEEEPALPPPPNCTDH